MTSVTHSRVLPIALVLLGPALIAQAQAVQTPALRAGALESTHRIDGLLDEPAWATAEVIDVFTQADPREGEPASPRTVVRVLAGPKALVIGIDCEQPPGVGVVSFSVRRRARRKSVGSTHSSRGGSAGSTVASWTSINGRAHGTRQRS